MQNIYQGSIELIPNRRSSTTSDIWFVRRSILLGYKWSGTINYSVSDTFVAIRSQSRNWGVRFVPASQWKTNTGRCGLKMNKKKEVKIESCGINWGISVWISQIQFHHLNKFNTIGTFSALKLKSLGIFAVFKNNIFHWGTVVHSPKIRLKALHFKTFILQIPQKYFETLERSWWGCPWIEIGQTCWKKNY